VAVKAWAAPAVVVKKAAVAIAAQLLHLAQQPQRNALRHLRLPRVALTTWTTTFRFNVYVSINVKRPVTLRARAFCASEMSKFKNHRWMVV